MDASAELGWILHVLRTTTPDSYNARRASRLGLAEGEPVSAWLHRATECGRVKMNVHGRELGFRWLMVVLSFLMCSGIGRAQQAGSDWTKVQAIDRGTLIRVSSRHRPTTCSFIAADLDTLTCTKTQTIFFIPVTHRLVYLKPEVTTVKLSRQFISALAGAGIGAGVGAGTGAGLESNITAKRMATCLPSFSPFWAVVWVRQSALAQTSWLGQQSIALHRLVTSYVIPIGKLASQALAHRGAASAIGVVLESSGRKIRAAPVRAAL